MPLKLVKQTAAKKLGPIAATYRSGNSNPYGTCPATCALNPNPKVSTNTIDEKYLKELLNAVPKNGHAWTYSHFNHTKLPKPTPGQTIINASCDSTDQALEAHFAGHPTTYAAPLNEQTPKTINGVSFVPCPADINKEKVTCSNCGNGRPLCARGNRGYVIVFRAHGTSKKKVGSSIQGGCYASSGPTKLQWDKTQKSGEPETTLVDWAKSLPEGSLLRHHVAGDIGISV